MISRRIQRIQRKNCEKFFLVIIERLSAVAFPSSTPFRVCRPHDRCQWPQPVVGELAGQDIALSRYRYSARRTLCKETISLSIECTRFCFVARVNSSRGRRLSRLFFRSDGVNQILLKSQSSTVRQALRYRELSSFLLHRLGRLVSCVPDVAVEWQGAFYNRGGSAVWNESRRECERWRFV